MECFTAIAPAIPHAVDLILDNKEKVKDTHNVVQCNVTSCSYDASCTNPVRHFFISETK